MYIDRGTLRQLVEATQRINEESVKTKIDPKKIKVPYDGKVAKGITRLEFLERVFTSTPDPKKMGTNIVTFVDRKHEERMYQTKEGLWKHFMQDYLDTGRLPSGQGVGRYRMVRVNGVCWGSSMDSTYWKHLAETVAEANSGGMAGAYIRQMAEKNYQKALDAYSHYSDAGLQNPNRLRELEMELDRACERCKQVHAKCCKITEEADPVDEATLMKALRTGDRTDRMKASYRQMRVDAKRREAILRKVNDYGVIPEFDPAVKKVKDPRALEVRSSDELAASHDMSMNALDYGKGTIVGRRWDDPVPKSKAKARADEIKSQSWKRDIRKAQKDREARMQRIRRLGGVERRRVDRKYRPTDDELNYGNF
jgi:hypothetical protein